MKTAHPDKKMKKTPPSFEEVQRLFHLPIHQAVILSGHDKNTLTKILRENGMKRWPYSYKKDVHSKKDRTADLFTVFKVKIKSSHNETSDDSTQEEKNGIIKRQDSLEKINIRNLCE